LAKLLRLPIEAVRHIFGHGDPDKEQYMARLSMIKTKNDIPEGLKILSKIEISETPPAKNHLLSPVVERVPLPTARKVGGKPAPLKLKMGNKWLKHSKAISPKQGDLLHDATAVFYTNDQLTSYINGARARIVRDTGCLRTVQVSQTPCTPVAGGNNPVIWAAGLPVNTGDYVFSNIFIYKVTAGGILGTVVPPYPSGTNVYPPSTPFTDGTATLQYAGPCEVINYASLPSGLQTLDVSEH
jgi:hypothetical protein